MVANFGMYSVLVVTILFTRVRSLLIAKSAAGGMLVTWCCIYLLKEAVMCVCMSGAIVSSRRDVYIPSFNNYSRLLITSFRSATQCVVLVMENMMCMSVAAVLVPLLVMVSVGYAVALLVVHFMVGYSLPQYNIRSNVLHCHWLISGTDYEVTIWLLLRRLTALVKRACADLITGCMALHLETVAPILGLATQVLFPTDQLTPELSSITLDDDIKSNMLASQIVGLLVGDVLYFICIAVPKHDTTHGFFDGLSRIETLKMILAPVSIILLVLPHTVTLLQEIFGGNKNSLTEKSKP